MNKQNFKLWAEDIAAGLAMLALIILLPITLAMLVEILKHA